MSEDPKLRNLISGVDFYHDEKGLLVFTADYLFKRGYCCESRCRHCPYGFGEEGKKKDKSGKNK